MREAGAWQFNDGALEDDATARASSGPISMRWPAAPVTRVSWSTTTTEFPSARFLDDRQDADVGGV